MHEKRRAAGRNRFTLTPYLLLLPSMALFVMFTLWPFVKTIILSFALTDKKGDFVKWAGLSNYVRILTSSTFRQVFGNTIKFALIVWGRWRCPSCWR